MPRGTDQVETIYVVAQRKMWLNFLQTAGIVTPRVNDATKMLAAVERGEPQAADELLQLLYNELRGLAAFKMAQEPHGQTLQPTALVHEAWLKLIGSRNPSFKNRAHFFSAAAQVMRHILIDRARRKQTPRHGGDLLRVGFDELDLAAPPPDEQLALQYPVQAEVVRLRYFAGMTNEQVSELLIISLSTVKNYWNFSRAWLFKEIEGA